MSHVSFLQRATYIPEDQRYTNKNSQAAFCYSETIPAPTGKDDAQQKSVSCLPFHTLHSSEIPLSFQDMELLRFSLVLIQSWLTPVQYPKLFRATLGEKWVQLTAPRRPGLGQSSVH